MAQDPDQKPASDDIPDPQYPYGATPQATTPEGATQLPTQPAYASPSFYDIPQAAAPPEPAAQQPNNTPQGYGISPQNTYGAPGYPPPQYPYASPPQYGQPPQIQYGAASGYGHGAPAPQYGYPVSPAFEPVPQSSPLPLREAIRQLPGQYFKVITRPSSRTFAEEMGKAKWDIVWVQVAIYTLAATLLGFLSNYLLRLRVDTLTTVPSNSNTFTPQTIAILRQVIAITNVTSTYGQLLLIPISVFLGTGILFLLAKAFGGTGKFLTQLYTTLLFIVPLSIILIIVNILLSFIPTAGSILVLVLALGYSSYEGVLLGLMLVPVHRISGGRSVGAVLLLFGIVFLLACVLSFILAIFLTATLRPA